MSYFLVRFSACVCGWVGVVIPKRVPSDRNNTRLPAYIITMLIPQQHDCDLIRGSQFAK